MKQKTAEGLSHVLNQACAKIRQLVPKVVEMTGEDFSGEVTIKIPLNCGGMPSKPKISFTF